MNIYTPYTYHLYHRPTQMNYYGVRYIRNARTQAHPDDLWTSYFSSSKKVKALIQEFGQDSFDVRVRKTFRDKASAIDWERRVLERLKVHQNPYWLNVHARQCPTNLGNKHSAQTKRQISISRIGRYKITPDHMAKLDAGRCIVATVIFPDGTIHKVENLNRFCLDNGLDRSHMSKVAKGILNAHKGYRCLYA